MNGDLPPSSRLHGTRFCAAMPAMIRAVGAEPVNEIRASRRSATSLAPVDTPLPCTTLKTPGGSSAASAASARRAQDKGAHSGGLTTIVLPLARAGPAFQVVSIKGEFQGVMIAHTPA